MGMSTRGTSAASRRGRRSSHAPMSEINVTPFVDVMLVLLIIFMVAAPLLTAGVPLDLPQASGTPLEAQEQTPIVVSVTKDGQVFLGEEDSTPISLEELGPKLQAVAGARGGSEEPIFVRGDRAVSYGLVAAVMAQIKEAGFRRLSLVTEVEQGS